MDKRQAAFLAVAIGIVLLVQLEMAWMHMSNLEDRSSRGQALTAEEAAEIAARVGEGTLAQLRSALEEQEGKVLDRLRAQESSHRRAFAQFLETQNQMVLLQEDMAAKARADEGGQAPPFNDSEDGPPETCNRQLDIGRVGTVQWVPRKGKYLLALCTGGQMSNRLMCVRQNMLNAAVTNRTLLLPVTELDYDYRNLVDFNHFKLCFGKGAIMTVGQYKSTKGSNGTLRVDQLLCHIHQWQPDDFCETLKRRFEQAINMTFGSDQEVVRPAPRWSMRVADLRKKYGGNARVIAFANMFGVPLKDLPLNSLGGGPLAVSGPQCRALVQPSKLIMDAAQGFVHTYLGREFVAVHLRRGDFFQHCLGGDAKGRKPPCFIPIKQVAGCLHRRLEKLPNMTVVFLATDGEDLEVGLLSTLLESSSQGRPVPLLRLPALGTQPWAKGLTKAGLQNNPQIIAFLTKAICGLSKVFYGSWTSTFSGDIHRLRDWWHTNSCLDSGICDQSESGDFLDSFQ